MVGYPGAMHAGSQVKEAHDIIQAARAAEYFRSKGANTNPGAKESMEALGLESPLLWFSELKQAFALSIMAYNQETDHRREGFRQIAEEQADGTNKHRIESSDERWAWLNWKLEQRGVAPVRIPAADAALLIHRARSV